MKKNTCFLIACLITVTLFSQQTNIQVAENLVTEGIPAISSTLAAEVKNYTESRGASMAAWHPLKKEMAYFYTFLPIAINYIW